MRTLRHIGSLAVCLAACVPLIALGGTEMLDIDPTVAAKVAREKGKARAAGGAKGISADKAVVSDPNECGVNVGNVDTSKQAPGKLAPRENTVVITGPVINLGKCK